MEKAEEEFEKEEEVDLIGIGLTPLQVLALVAVAGLAYWLQLSKGDGGRMGGRHTTRTSSRKSGVYQMAAMGSSEVGVADEDEEAALTASLKMSLAANAKHAKLKSSSNKAGQQAEQEVAEQEEGMLPQNAPTKSAKKKSGSDKGSKRSAPLFTLLAGDPRF